jgi:hypothetical protein
MEYAITNRLECVYIATTPALMRLNQYKICKAANYKAAVRMYNKRRAGCDKLCVLWYCYSNRAADVKFFLTDKLGDRRVKARAAQHMHCLYSIEYPKLVEIAEKICSDLGVTGVVNFAQ